MKYCSVHSYYFASTFAIRRPNRHSPGRTFAFLVAHWPKSLLSKTMLTDAKLEDNCVDIDKRDTLGVIWNMATVSLRMIKVRDIKDQPLHLCGSKVVLLEVGIFSKVWNFKHD